MRARPQRARSAAFASRSEARPPQSEQVSLVNNVVFDKVRGALTAGDYLELHERISSVGVGLCAHCARLVRPLIYLPLLALTFALLWSLAAYVPSPALRSRRPRTPRPRRLLRGCLADSLPLRLVTRGFAVRARGGGRGRRRVRRLDADLLGAHRTGLSRRHATGRSCGAGEPSRAGLSPGRNRRTFGAVPVRSRP